MWLFLSAQVLVATLPDRIDLLMRPLECGPGSAEEVTVCGRRDGDRYRIPPQYRTDPGDEGLGSAETAIGKVRVGAVTEQGDVGGIKTNRIMLRIKIPF
jgi:hypothetical protein